MEINYHFEHFVCRDKIIWRQCFATMPIWWLFAEKQSAENEKFSAFPSWIFPRQIFELQSLINVDHVRRHYKRNCFSASWITWGTATRQELTKFATCKKLYHQNYFSNLWIFLQKSSGNREIIVIILQTQRLLWIGIKTWLCFHNHFAFSKNSFSKSEAMFHMII